MSATIDLKGKTRAELSALVMDLLAEMFELDKGIMAPGSELNADLDIDSIDAVDLSVRLGQMTGKRLPPDVFKTIRTIGDVADALGCLAEEQST